MLDTRQIHKQILALDNGDDASRRQVLNSLRQFKEPDWATAALDVINPLLKSLKGQLANGVKQQLVQKEVATILGNIGPRSKSALPELVELLKEGVPDPVREATVNALGKIGKEAKVAVDQLVLMLESCRPTLANLIVRALGNIGHVTPAVRTGLINIWLSPNQVQGSQIQVAITLCKLQIDAKGLLALLTRNLMASSDTALRIAAAEALGWCGKNDSDVVPALLAASLSDTKEEVRQMAQAALDKMGLTHDKAINICAKQLGTSPYAEAAMRKSGPVAIPALIAALSKEDPAIRVKAARTLGCLEDAAAKAIPTLTASLQDGDRDFRLAAAKSLWNISKDANAVVPVLINLLKIKGAADGEADETQRNFVQSVMESLGRIGPPALAAVPALNVMKKDKNRLIRESAASALEKIGPAVSSKAGSQR